MSTTKTQPNVDDPNAYQHKFAEANGIRMHYVDEGEGPLVILLHGFPFLWYLWRNQIKVLAAAGYRVVAPDLRGYGQTDAPADPDDYTMTHMVGDVVGLMKALGEESAILVGQDAGTRIGHYCLQMRPELFRGLFMICSPPELRGPVRPAEAFKNFPKDMVFYQEYFGRPGVAAEIDKDIRNYLTGVYYSTSGACTDEEQWRALWRRDSERFEDTYVVPETLPPFLSQQAMDYVVSEFTRRGIQGAINLYAALDLTWRVTSFLDGVIVHHPAVFLTGERDPAAKPLFGTDRQAGALAALPTTFSNLQEIITLKGIGHTPPDESPDEVNQHLLSFLKGISTEGSQALTAG